MLGGRDAPNQPMVRGHLGSRLEHLRPPRPAGIFFSLCGIGAWGEPPAGGGSWLQLPQQPPTRSSSTLGVLPSSALASVAYLQVYQHLVSKMEPTRAEWESFRGMQDAADWAGLTNAQFNSILAGLGDPTSFREVAAIPLTTYSTCV